MSARVSDALGKTLKAASQPGRPLETVGGRIFPVVRPANEKAWPCIVYQAVGGTPVASLEGRMPRPAYRVETWSKGYGEGAALHDRLYQVLAHMVAEDPPSPTELFEEPAAVYRFSTSFVFHEAAGIVRDVNEA